MTKAEETKELDLVPEGYDQVDTEIDDHPIHDFEVQPVCEGTVVKVKDAIIKKGTDDERESRLAVVETKDGLRTLWEAANLENLFRVLRPGDGIYVAFDGWQEMGRNRRMRKFKAFRKRG